jgi:hypothetical protein
VSASEKANSLNISPFNLERRYGFFETLCLKLVTINKRKRFSDTKISNNLRGKNCSGLGVSKQSRSGIGGSSIQLFVVPNGLPGHLALCLVVTLHELTIDSAPTPPVGGRAST